MSEELSKDEITNLIEKTISSVANDTFNDMKKEFGSMVKEVREAMPKSEKGSADLGSITKEQAMSLLTMDDLAPHMLGTCSCNNCPTAKFVNTLVNKGVQKGIQSGMKIKDVQNNMSVMTEKIKNIKVRKK